MRRADSRARFALALPSARAPQPERLAAPPPPLDVTADGGAGGGAPPPRSLGDVAPPPRTLGDVARTRRDLDYAQEVDSLKSKPGCVRSELSLAPCSGRSVQTAAC